MRKSLMIMSMMNSKSASDVCDDKGYMAMDAFSNMAATLSNMAATPICAGPITTRANTITTRTAENILTKTTIVAADCPKCSSSMTVLETRVTYTKIRRRWICKVCHARATSYTQYTGATHVPHTAR